jgi:hypothetical protein
MSLSLQLSEDESTRHRRKPTCVVHSRYTILCVNDFLHTLPVIIGALSTILFTLLVLASSFITTYLLYALEDTAEDNYSWSRSIFFYSGGPITLAYDLLRAVLRILKDKDESGALSAVFDGFSSSTTSRRRRVIGAVDTPPPPPGILRRLIARFLLGLPVVGIGSLVSMLLTLPIVGPLQWIARYRGHRRNRDTSDIAAVIIVALILVGAAK